MNEYKTNLRLIAILRIYIVGCRATTKILFKKTIEDTQWSKKNI